MPNPSEIPCLLTRFVSHSILVLVSFVFHAFLGVFPFFGDSEPYRGVPESPVTLRSSPSTSVYGFSSCSTWKLTRKIYSYNRASYYVHRREMIAQQKVQYTVKQTAKIHQEKPKDPRPSLWLAVAKWLVAVFLFLSVLACVVASKISLLSIAHFRGNGSEPHATSYDLKAQKETVFIMMVFVLIIPEAFTFLKACWTSLLRKSHKWPCARAIILVG